MHCQLGIWTLPTLLADSLIRTPPSLLCFIISLSFSVTFSVSLHTFVGIIVTQLISSSFMASFCSVLLAMSLIFIPFYCSPVLASRISVDTSTISAAPAVLPGDPLDSPALSPDIAPLFPTPGGSALSPEDSSMPTITASPSPPNPDGAVAPGPEFPLPQSDTLPTSSSVSLNSLQSLRVALHLSFSVILFIMQIHRL